ncbi:MAG: EAL domain-containing protein [Alteromonadaceae bacterium]|nr:EAL domain-containing protein [Alteromonadaceae bacterium]
MDSSCLLNDLISKYNHKKLWRKSFFGLLFALFSLPSYAAQPFSFIEYNLAFVLGVSLPILLISVLLNKKITIVWQFPALLTLSIFAFLYSLAQLTQHQTTYVLTAASLFLAFIYLWPYFNQTEKTIKNKHIHVIVITALSTSYIVSIWFFSAINAYFTWLLNSAVILIIALVRLIQIHPQQKPHTRRMLIQWLLALSFAINTYLWLNAKITVNTLSLICVLTYLITIMNGNWLLIQKIISDLSSLKEPKVEQISHHELFTYTHDPATRLPTHQHALKHFEQILKTNEQPDYAVIVFQPVDFIEVNTFLGHQNSDVLLLQLAYCLQQKTAQNNALINFEKSGEVIKLARLQGLRFLIIVDLAASHHPDKAVINDVCKQLAVSVPKAMSFKSFSLSFELAFGVSLIKSHDENVNKVIAYAEDALLKNKENKQSINYFDNAQLLHTEQQLAKMEALKTAIIDNQISWYIQPQLALQDRAIQGFYLSAYWYQSSGQENTQYNKLVLEQFLPIAELSGDIYLLARKMITEAFKLLAQLHQLGCYKTVAINLSSKYLLEPDLIDFIEQRSHQYNIACKYLLVELSEKLIVSEKTLTKEFIDQLKALEIKIAINEFSGSYEALRFLRKIIVDQIKINCQQLTDHEDMATDKAITNALINLASTIDIPLIGTNIDNAFTEQVYSAIGGRLAQGNTLVSALTPAEVQPWLRAWHQQYPHTK